MAVMAREAWTDKRLDDLKEHMDEGFKEVKGEIRDVKFEIRELRNEIGGINNRFDRLNLTIIAGLLGLIATHYLG
jgi:archaellum component FlaC